MRHLSADSNRFHFNSILIEDERVWACGTSSQILIDLNSIVIEDVSVLARGISSQMLIDFN